jgi:uncharacterized RDD family membrane protein YckC
MSTHLFPAHMRMQNQHDNPESFLTGAAAILAVLVILIALAVAVAAAFGAVMGIFIPASPSVAMPDRVDCSLGTLISPSAFVAVAGAPRLPEPPYL